MPNPVLVNSMGRRRQFSVETKAEIVAHALSSGEPLAHTARYYDIAQPLLHKWIRDAKAASIMPSTASPDSAFIRVEQKSNVRPDSNPSSLSIRLHTPKGIIIEICDRLTFPEVARLARELESLQ